MKTIYLMIVIAILGAMRTRTRRPKANNGRTKRENEKTLARRFSKNTPPKILVEDDQPEVVSPSNQSNGNDEEASQNKPLDAPTFVIKTLFFSREENGVSDGFDLDDTVSDGRDAQGCYNSDFMAPDDTEGIDNQFALLLPLIEAAGGEALGPYTQTAVNSGNLLLFFELVGVDDMKNDSDVTLRLYRVVGDTLVGTDGFLQPWQTFDIDLESAWIDTKAQIVDGILTSEGFKFALPFYIFDFYFEARIQGGHLKITFGENGVHTGVIGGAVTLSNIQEIADAVEGGDDEAALIQRLGSLFADLLPDDTGDCQAMSVTLKFETTGAFLYEDSPRFSEAPKP